MTFELFAKDEQNLLGTTSNYLRSSQEISEHFKACDIMNKIFSYIRMYTL